MKCQDEPDLVNNRERKTPETKSQLYLFKEFLALDELKFLYKFLFISISCMYHKTTQDNGQML